MRICFLCKKWGMSDCSFNADTRANLLYKTIPGNTSLQFLLVRNYQLEYKINNMPTGCNNGLHSGTRLMIIHNHQTGARCNLPGNFGPCWLILYHDFETYRSFLTDHFEQKQTGRIFAKVKGIGVFRFCGNKHVPDKFSR